jgi:hypothetical protein
MDDTQSSLAIPPYYIPRFSHAHKCRITKSNLVYPIQTLLEEYDRLCVCSASLYECNIDYYLVLLLL